MISAVAIQTEAHTRQHLKDANGHLVKKSLPRQKPDELFASLIHDAIAVQGERTSPGVRTLIVYDNIGVQVTVIWPGTSVSGSGQSLEEAVRKCGFAVQLNTQTDFITVSGHGLSARHVTLDGALRRLA